MPETLDIYSTKDILRQKVFCLYLKYVIQIQSLEIHWARTFSNENCYWDWCKVRSGVDAHDF